MSIAIPAIGDPTKQSLAANIINELASIRSLTGSTAGGIQNGSFEDDLNADGVPDAWTLTLYTGGSFSMDTTDTISGATSAKFVSPGGSGNGGGYLESTNFFPVSTDVSLRLLWESKSSVATVRNIVQLRWYDAAQSFLSSTNYYSSITNPTVWTAQGYSTTPPAGAKFAKVRIVGAENTTTVAGTVRYDNFFIGSEDPMNNLVLFSASGSFAVPPNVTRVRARVWGGGEDGANATGTGGGDGGAGGGYGEQFMQVVPGETLTVTVGASAANGGTGGTSSVVGSLASTSAAGGSNGTGGTSSASINVSGGNGGFGGINSNSASGGCGGNGGGPGGPGGPGGGGANTGTGKNGRGGRIPGGGGGGGGAGNGGGGTGGGGAAGRVTIEY